MEWRMPDALIVPCGTCVKNHPTHTHTHTSLPWQHAQCEVFVDLNGSWLVRARGVVYMNNVHFPELARRSRAYSACSLNQTHSAVAAAAAQATDACGAIHQSTSDSMRCARTTGPNNPPTLVKVDHQPNSHSVRWRRRLFVCLLGNYIVGPTAQSPAHTHKHTKWVVSETCLENWCSPIIVCVWALCTMTCEHCPTATGVSVPIAQRSYANGCTCAVATMSSNNSLAHVMRFRITAHAPPGANAFYSWLAVRDFMANWRRWDHDLAQ